MKKAGIYIIKDKFFEDMPDTYLKGNKAGNRFHYYCLEEKNTGIYCCVQRTAMQCVNLTKNWS